MTHDEVKTIADQVHQTVDTLVKTAMMQTRDIGGSCYIATQASLSANMCAALIVAKRPDWLSQKSEENSTPDDLTRAASQMITSETLVFAALLGAYSMESLSPNGECRSTFGPPILWQALESWSKIFPDRLADHYFEPNMLSAARNAGRKITNPLDELLASRITNRNLPDTLN